MDEEYLDFMDQDELAKKRFSYSFNEKFWKVRYKGDRLHINNASDIIDAAISYFEWCDNNPIKEPNWVGKDGKEVAKFKPRVFTMVGFSTYIGRSTSYISDLEQSSLYKSQTLDDPAEREHYKELYEAIQWVKDCITRNKYENAASGYLSHVLISRDIFGQESLTVKGDRNNPISHVVDGKVDFSTASDEALRAIISENKPKE